jgi:hypothetical protein
MKERRGSAAFTYEIDLSWQAASGSPPLALKTLPGAGGWG